MYKGDDMIKKAGSGHGYETFDVSCDTCSTGSDTFEVEDWGVSWTLWATLTGKKQIRAASGNTCALTANRETDMKTAYITHPFSGDEKGNIEKVRRICEKIKHKVVPLAPHLLLPSYIDEATERELAMTHCKALLLGCDEVWICSQNITQGMTEELTYAAEHGKKIINRGNMI
jgi:hypothetical protein